MSLEQRINYQLNKIPILKRIIKYVYQHTMYLIFPKSKSVGNILRLSPNDKEHEYFFGYYGICPWDITDRYILCLKTNDTKRHTAPSIPAEILLIDTLKSETDPHKYETIATTHTWNVQQGCMMQWLGPGFDREIIYNDFDGEKYISIVLDVFTKKRKILSAPIYSVSADGTFALTLDFSRLHRLRPGYGYSNIQDATSNNKLPDSTCIWKLNIRDNTVIPLLKYTDFFAFETKESMINAEHKVNHIMINPSGTRFLVLHRWKKNGRTFTRLVTADINGTNMYNLSDDDMVSHCTWKDDNTVLAFENKNGQGQGYYLMKDRSNEYSRLWKDINGDGHPSYSPNGKLVITDTYANSRRMCTIKLLDKYYCVDICSVFEPFCYDNNTRCDLHPRWNREGNQISFDSVYEDHRGLYMVNVDCNSIKYED